MFRRQESKGWFAPRPRPRSSRGLRGAVRHRQDQKYAQQDQQAYDQRMAAPADGRHHRRSRATQENSSSSPS